MNSAGLLHSPSTHVPCPTFNILSAPKTDPWGLISRCLCLLIPSWVWPMQSILRGLKGRREWGGDYIQFILVHHGLAAHSSLSPSNRPLSAAIPSPGGANGFSQFPALSFIGFLKHCPNYVNNPFRKLSSNVAETLSATQAVRIFLTIGYAVPIATSALQKRSYE